MFTWAPSLSSLFSTNYLNRRLDFVKLRYQNFVRGEMENSFKHLSTPKLYVIILYS